jgi:hypothetical protein
MKRRRPRGYPLPLTAITEILGVPYADRGQFHHVVAVIMASNLSQPATGATPTTPPRRIPSVSAD